MSFIFLNTDGNILNGNDFANLNSSLEGGEIEIVVRNNSAINATNPVIFLQPSSNLGSVDYPSKRPPNVDYGDLLVWGSTLDENTGEPKSGLYLKEDGVKKYFSLTQGSNYKNGIALNAIDAEASVNITLGFTPELNDDIRRLYIGIEVYDSRTNI